MKFKKKETILCKDKSNKCKELASKGLCKTNYKISNEICRKTCNACEPNNVKFYYLCK